MMDLTFKTERKKPGMRFLRFLPKNFRSIGVLSVFLNIIALLIAAIFYPGLQKEIPLFYSLPGDQQLVNKNYIFILPAIATTINALHFLIAYLEKEINYNILKMFVQVTLMIQFLLLVILLRIIIIV
jgi:hypothetical protein